MSHSFKLCYSHFEFLLSLSFQLTKLEKINTNDHPSAFVFPLPPCIEALNEACFIVPYFFFWSFRKKEQHTRTIHNRNVFGFQDKQNSRQWKIVVNNWTTTLTQYSTTTPTASSSLHEFNTIITVELIHCSIGDRLTHTFKSS